MSSKSQRQPLPSITPKQARIVAAKVKATIEGKTQRSFAREIYPNMKQASAEAEVAKNLNKPNVKEVLQDALARHGLTVDRIMATVDDAMSAEKDLISNGEVVASRPDHSIRLKAAGMAANFMGISKQAGDTTVNFIHFAQNQRDIYDI